MHIVITVAQVPDVAAIQRNMLGEIDKEFHQMADEGIVFLNRKIADWQNKTTLRKKVDVEPGKWQYQILHDSASKAGQIFDWVNGGTGLDGPRQSTYPIVPRNAPALSFTVPHSPKTLAPGQSVPSGPKTAVRTLHVDHPGIKKRDFTGGLKENVKKEIVPRTYKAARRGLQKR